MDLEDAASLTRYFEHEMVLLSMVEYDKLLCDPRHNCLWCSTMSYLWYVSLPSVHLPFSYDVEQT